MAPTTHNGKRYYRDLCNELDYGTRAPSANARITARDNRRKIANNTYLSRDTGSGEMVLTLHSTDILTVDARGVITLSTGGWDTVTTRARLNESRNRVLTFTQTGT